MPENCTEKILSKRFGVFSETQSVFINNKNGRRTGFVHVNAVCAEAVVDYFGRVPICGKTCKIILSENDRFKLPGQSQGPNNQQNQGPPQNYGMPPQQNFGQPPQPNFGQPPSNFGQPPQQQPNFQPPPQNFGQNQQPPSWQNNPMQGPPMTQPNWQQGPPPNGPNMGGFQGPPQNQPDSGFGGQPNGNFGSDPSGPVVKIFTINGQSKISVFRAKTCSDEAIRAEFEKHGPVHEVYKHASGVFLLARVEKSCLNLGLIAAKIF